MKAVSIKDLSFKYNDNEDFIFENVNFDLSYGEITLLAGVSGYGKSTLTSLINGIIPNLISGNISGEILINGTSNKNKTVGEISKEVGTVLQNAEQQIIKQDVLDEIAFGCENLGFSLDKIDSLIDENCSLMKLDKYSKAKYLSGGQKQRLITATTLAMDSKIIILDEPLANLDNDGAKTLMEVMITLKKKGHAILIVEHRIDEVIDYVDKIYEIKNKKIHCIDNKNTYLTKYTKIIPDTSNNNATNDLLFDISKINFSPKNKTILEDITFSINKGERIVILGENGCGKTTLTKIITRLLKQTSGEVIQKINPKFKNKTKGNKEWFSNVGYVFQNPNYQLFMPTVEKEILFSGISIDFCQYLVDKLELGPLLDRHPHSLSEGQKRKVSLASILASNPSVLILDEPTVGQDYEGLTKLCSILNEIHDKYHNTMITITHDKRCALALCDKAILIENGIVSKIGCKELVKNYFNY